jgi:hypothetical protein
MEVACRLTPLTPDAAHEPPRPVVPRQTQPLSCAFNLPGARLVAGHTVRGQLPMSGLVCALVLAAALGASTAAPVKVPAYPADAPPGQKYEGAQQPNEVRADRFKFSETGPDWGAALYTHGSLDALMAMLQVLGARATGVQGRHGVHCP